MENLSQYKFEKLVQSLQCLAANYKDQIAAFPDFVHIPDELALNYYEEVLYCKTLFEEKIITNEQWLKIKEIDMLFEMMSDHKHPKIWTLNSLKKDPFWQKIREKAKGVLHLLNVKQVQPKLEGITYIPSKSPIIN